MTGIGHEFVICIACGQQVPTLEKKLTEALDELLGALADARRRYEGGDMRAIESTMLAATERAAQKLVWVAT
jgi:hypothetical protein